MNQTETALAERSIFAREIAREAGLKALAFFADRAALTIDTKRNAQDAVTMADRQVELLLRERIRARFPGDGLLGEEFGLEEGRSDFTWVMDPIDGTSPFIFGMDSWCVSIAVIERDRPVIGTIYAPVADEMFVADRGGGASLNGAPLRLGGEATVQNGIVGVGASHRIAPGVVGRFVERLLELEGIFIRNGSGALMLAYVAAGRLAAYWEPHMNAWDCLAGLLIVEEAGGWIHDPREWPSLEAGGLVLAGAAGTRGDMLMLAGLVDQPPAGQPCSPS
ncbi:inositol monophosphatase family protein [Consotaella salsifontis]|uniref:Inositol-1-monophosphatase n=1 Tax=Consotaella salsifontis TaxID=1365950 RepID=A0A1T4T1T4_9HYPH|nr:inositol monophosphatase [Consotaella salsifontis]SKA34470.1 myo-inositol-1(or 4)-monophosphatase [Consotaella salsifontis]